MKRTVCDACTSVLIRWNRRNQLIRVVWIGQSHWTKSMFIHTSDSVEWTMSTRPSIFYFASHSSFYFARLSVFVLNSFSLCAHGSVFHFFSFCRLLSLCSFCNSHNPAFATHSFASSHRCGWLWSFLSRECSSLFAYDMPMLLLFVHAFETLTLSTGEKNRNNISPSTHTRQIGKENRAF